MKKTWIIVVAVIVLLILSIMGRYNKMVSYDENTKTAWSQVENVYQRRLDLIPNLVSTVKGFAAQEKSIFVEVTQARADATKMDININDAEQFAQFQKSQWEVSSALSKLLAVVENYPDLKSNQNFLELQAQLEGSENRITVERKNFNETANVYNKYIRVFPNNIISSMFGFLRTNLFESVEGAETPPVVDFGTAPAATETPAVPAETPVEAPAAQ